MTMTEASAPTNRIEASRPPEGRADDAYRGAADKPLTTLLVQTPADPRQSERRPG